MPYETTQPLNEINSLEEIFKEVYHLFEIIVSEWSNELFEETHRNLLQVAWNELEKTAPGIYEQLKYPNANLTTRLKEVGLWKEQAQFKAKLFGIKEVWEKFVNNKIIDLLKILLGWINDLFTSLASGIPGVEAWDEFKKLIEKWIKKNQALSNIPLN